MPANSGTTNVVLNTRERIVSTDFNRLQSLADRDRAEMFRYWMLAALSEATGDGIAVVPSTVTSPATGIILNGFLVKPQSGGTDLVIDPGVAMVIDPDAAPSSDDSPAKSIIDPGCTLAGSFSANAGPGNRVDVVEVARVRADRNGDGNVDSPALVLETSSRDTYNPATGLFTAGTVNKVFKGGLFTYRVRRGTAGGGFPGTASGWMPIMVAVVPTSATKWDDCQMWDVRPLMADRIAPTFALSDAMPRRDFVTGGAHADYAVADTSPLVVKGSLRGSIGMWRAGGDIPTAGFDIEGNDVGETAGWSTTIATQKCWHFYAAMPFGLPRWAKYAGSPRLPIGFRGIPIATTKEAANAEGGPVSALSFPTNTLLAGTTSNAVVLFSGTTKTSGSPRVFPAVSNGDGWIKLAQAQLAASSVTVVAGVEALNFTDAGGLFPPNARELLIRVTYAYAGGTNNAIGDYNYFVEANDLSTMASPMQIHQFRTSVRYSGAGAAHVVFDMVLPLRPTFPHDLGQKSRIYTFNSPELFGSVGSPTETISIAIVGWRL